MATINVDFEVYQQLTIRRRSESMTENEVIRELLGLSKAQQEPRQDAAIGKNGASWVSKGISFPDGTEFRAVYKGQMYTANVKNGALVLNGKRFSSPSAAAIEITGTPVNGWRFWECLKQGSTEWKSIAMFRNAPHDVLENF